MSIERRQDGAIVLAGTCGPEDAEPLLQMLIDTPVGPVEWSSCEHLHTAVVQILLLTKPDLVGPCGDAWIDQWISALNPGPENR